MQIYELTSKRRPTNEGVVSALAGGIAKQVGQQLLQKQGIESDRYAGQRVAAGQRQGGAAMAANMPALQLMAKKAQEAWVQTQQQLAQKANPPVASAAFLPTDQLKPHLTALINQLVGFDYNKEPVSDPKSPEMALSIKTARDFINREVDQILSLTKEKPEQSKRPLEASWLELATKGIGPMQTYQQAASSAGQARGTAAPQQQAAQQLADKIKMSAQQIADLKNYTKLNGGKITPALASLVGANDTTYQQAAE